MLLSCKIDSKNDGGYNFYNDFNIRGNVMRKYFTAFQMTQSMFCSLPFPCRDWDEKCRPYMLIFLPFVGLEIGILWMVIDFILQKCGFNGFIYGLVMCVWPYLATGFMHLDGFMDVTDAVCSWRDLEKRRRILKDSHVGSFAVVWCVFLILAGFAVFSAVPTDASRWCLLLIPVLSRCCSALAVMQLKTMITSQYAQTTSYPKWHKALLVILMIACVLAGFAFLGNYGFVFVAGLAGYGIALKKSYDSLQGMNGDISGFCICISELCAAAVFALL